MNFTKRISGTLKAERNQNEDSRTSENAERDIILPVREGGRKINRSVLRDKYRTRLKIIKTPGPINTYRRERVFGKK